MACVPKLWSTIVWTRTWTRPCLLWRSPMITFSKALDWHLLSMLFYLLNFSMMCRCLPRGKRYLAEKGELYFALVLWELTVTNKEYMVSFFFLFFNLSLELDSIRCLKCELNITLSFGVVVIIFHLLCLWQQCSLWKAHPGAQAPRGQRCWFLSLAAPQMLFLVLYSTSLVEIGPHSVVRAGLKLPVLLPRLLKCWYHSVPTSKSHIFKHIFYVCHPQF